ncbi:unnamed protein product [Chrysoparadoxa australica]
MKHQSLPWLLLACPCARAFVPAAGGVGSSSKTRVYAAPRVNPNAMPLTPRRQQFFDAIVEELNKSWKKEDVSKIHDFVAYCKGELMPKPQGYLHDPSEEYVAGLTGQSWWEKEAFPWAAQLEEQSPIIQQEFKEYLEARSVFRGDSKVSQVMGAGWSSVRLQRFGMWLDNCQYFPKTESLLKELGIPLAVRGVMFAQQKPGTGVGKHSDGRNFILTAHLGIDVPEGDCWMSSGGVKKQWKNNEVIILDTSYVHETGNYTESPRYVLIIDFWHPELTEPEREALAFVYDLRNRFEAGEVPAR